ncbi:ABC transporter substrate-binding protein [Ruminococcus sp.]|uniref:ABC transporter substrate-binding protein n=1 Tax=Ruminococcus sp. TaxID=41978 RepID=UPI002E791962|nr:ABC transporter substrate-binding protein [Ruminococcus sp.]MEE1261874.1 ABC transporter substrate-binding protein [Ruminococcus sp.]
MKKLLSILLVAAMAIGLCACAGGSSGSGDGAASDGDTIKIGYVNPTTGALAGNGEGCEWAVKQITDYVKEHPITVDGKEKTIDVIVYDSKSDQNTCTEMAQKLIEEDNIDLMIAIQTPNTVIPVAQVAERYGVPCIATQSPVDPLANSLDEFNWTYDFFYTLDEVYESQRALWTKAGYAPGSGAKVGLLFANDTDGTSWHDLFIKRLAEDGYTAVDPGQYPSKTTDFTNVANKFKEEKIDLIAGTNIPPDFMNAYNAVIEAGVEIGCITMGKCCLLQSDVEALGDLADGIMTQVWWAPSNPFKSDLTGVDCKTINEMYEKDNGRVMPQPTAFAYAGLELAVQTFKNAGTTEKKAVYDAIGKLDCQTIVGSVDYSKKLKGLPYSSSVLTGGQWQRDENGELNLVIIDNSLYPDIPLTGEYVEGNATTNKKSD